MCPQRVGECWIAGLEAGHTAWIRQAQRRRVQTAQVAESLVVCVMTKMPLERPCEGLGYSAQVGGWVFWIAAARCVFVAGFCGEKSRRVS